MLRGHQQQWKKMRRETEKAGEDRGGRWGGVTGRVRYFADIEKKKKFTVDKRQREREEEMIHWRFSKRSRLHAVLHFPKEHPSLLLPPAGSALTHTDTHTHIYPARLSGWGRGTRRCRETARDSDGEGKRGLERGKESNDEGCNKKGRKRKTWRRRERRWVLEERKGEEE